MKLIPITKGRNAIVDDVWFPVLNRWSWHLASDGYAVRCFKVDGKDVHLFMHRFITGASDKHWVDHINHDGLDNREENLRVGPPHINNRNRRKRAGCSTQYKGVCLPIGRHKFVAMITIDGKRKRIGGFTTAEEAALAYNDAAFAAWGDVAWLNTVPA